MGPRPPKTDIVYDYYFFFFLHFMRPRLKYHYNLNKIILKWLKIEFQVVFFVRWNCFLNLLTIFSRIISFNQKKKKKNAPNLNRFRILWIFIFKIHITNLTQNVMKLKYILSTIIWYDLFWWYRKGKYINVFIYLDV